MSPAGARRASGAHRRVGLGWAWCVCWRRGWASARVRDAVRGRAVSTWPRRRKREATTKRRGPRREPGQGSGDAGRIREVSGPVSGRGGQDEHGDARLVGRRGQSEEAANGWLALIQTETRARHEQQQTGPGSHGSSGGLAVSDQPRPERGLARAGYPGTTGTHCRYKY